MATPNNTLEERHNSAWAEAAKVRLEINLKEKLGSKFSVKITNNRHTMLSVKSRKGGGLEARLHHMFLDAPDNILVALCRYLQTRDPLSSRLLDDFIKSRNHQIQKRPARKNALQTQGQVFDLQELYHDLNRRFFGGSVTAEITWGRPSRPGQARSTIKLGSYSLEEKLIRIHPALDKTFVPRYFIEWIVYHEMLHHVVPIPVRAGRRCFHSDEFRARERLFPQHELASTWERTNLHLLLQG